MKRFKRKKSGIILGVLFVTLGLGLGYSILTERLEINNTVSYDQMKWDVGFKDEEVDISSYLSDLDRDYILATVDVADDGKSATFSCKFKKKTASQICINGLRGFNNSTFDIVLTDLGYLNLSDEVNTLRQKYVSAPYLKWFGGELDGESYDVGDILKPNVTQDFIIYVESKELTKDMLPSDENGLSFEYTLYADWTEYSEEE